MEIAICYKFGTITHIAIFAELKPKDTIEYMVQSKRDKESIECTVDKYPYLIKSDDSMGECMLVAAVGWAGHGG